MVRTMALSSTRGLSIFLILPLSILLAGQLLSQSVTLILKRQRATKLIEEMAFLEPSTSSFYPSRDQHQNSSSSSSPSDEGNTELLFLPRVWKSFPINETFCLKPPQRKFKFNTDTKTGFPLETLYRKGNYDNTTFYRTGFLFNKPMKVGGTTASGVLLRMAKNLAERYQKDYQLCDGIYDHTPGRKFQHRIPSQSFLMSLLRHPTKRHISHFYHIYVSREGMEPTLENFQEYEKERRDYYIRKHSVRPAQHIFEIDRTNQSEIAKVVNEILDQHDFFAVTERFDESLVVLQLLLGVPLGDMLYLNAKSNGGYDGGRSRHGCTYIIPSKDLPPDIQEYIQSEEWEDVVKWENILYQVVNQSLDATIESLGRSNVERQLQRFHHAQKIASEQCRDKAIFPCSDTGERRDSWETNCLFVDAGCGYPCIDQVAHQMGLYEES
jgi:hypothetical protein